MPAPFKPILSFLCDNVFMKTVFDEFQNANKNQAKPGKIEPAQNIKEHETIVKSKYSYSKTFVKLLKEEDVPKAVVILIRFIELMKKYVVMPLINRLIMLLIVIMIVHLTT